MSIKNPLSDSDFLHELKNEIDPIESQLAINLKEKIFSVYTAVKYHGLYISNDLIDFKDQNDRIEIVHFPSALLSANLVNRSSTLVSGASGSGKTATVRYIDRLMTGSSIVEMKNIIHCDKEIQKEDWLGFLDPKDVISGKGGWNIDWAEWTNGRSVTFDEITRANSNFQNTALLVMNDGRIQHNVKFSKTLSELHIFMTENPRDELMGNVHVTPLSHAFLDRVTQRLLVESPKGWAMELVNERRDDERSIGYSEDDVIQLQMEPNELRCASVLVEKIPVNKDANTYAINLAKNADLCIRAPLYTKSLLQSIKPMNGLCENCHFEKSQGYCKHIFGSSMRMYKDLIAMGKAYAFWLNLNSVTKYLINSIAPDIISHRLIVPESVLRKDKKNTYGNKRKYIQERYIDKELSLLMKRKEAEKSFENLIYGKGTDRDLNKLKNYGNEDLFVRIEMIPMVTKGIDITQNLLDSGNLESYSCLEKEYKDFMSHVNQAYNEKDKNKLQSLLNKSGFFPKGNLIVDLIHGYLRKLDFKG